MPELPEIETIKNGLSRFLLFKKIKTIEVLDSKLIDFSSSKLKQLIGDEIVKIDRRAKYLLVFLKKSNNVLVIHLKMTGQLIYLDASDKRKEIMVAGGHSDQDNSSLGLDTFRHIKLRIRFIDNSCLILNDARRFAFLKFMNQDELEELDNRLGVEPLSPRFTLKVFQKLLGGRRRNIKAFLLDQSYVAGLGNIYVDEILFASEVAPWRRVDSLTAIEGQKIYHNIKKILKLAIQKGGTTFNDYRAADGSKGSFLSHLQVYGRRGSPCHKCGKKIEKTKIAGRGTSYCPHCQV